MKKHAHLAFVLGLLASCVTRETYYTAVAPGVEVHEAADWDESGPYHELSSSTGARIGLHFEEYGYYAWTILFVIPIGLVSWTWDELDRPISESTLGVELSSEEDKGSVELAVGEVTLRLGDGSVLAPTEVELLSHPTWRADDPDWPGARLVFSLPDGAEPPFELFLGGLWIDGVLQVFPPLEVHRRKGWKIVVAG